MITFLFLLVSLSLVFESVGFGTCFGCLSVISIRLVCFVEIAAKKFTQ